MDEQIAAALKTDFTIDITTRGRKTGADRRIEIWFHNINGRLYITGSPGIRSWYANLLVHSDLTFHSKESVIADLPARANKVVSAEARRLVLGEILVRINHDPDDLDRWVEESPLVEVVLGSN